MIANVVAPVSSPAAFGALESATAAPDATAFCNRHETVKRNLQGLEQKLAIRVAAPEHTALELAGRIGIFLRTDSS